MANSFFKTLTSADRTQSRTLLHENIPITGTLLSGTYNVAASGREVNIKTFSHGMFQSVYDYPYASSSANHILDLSAGFSTNASSLSSSATSQAAKKVNIYNQMAQVLAGYDTGSNVRTFDADGNFAGSGGTKHHNVIFVNFSRLLAKDEIKKGSFSMNVGTSTSYTAPFDSISTVSDSDATNSYKTNSPAGEYGILKNTAATATVKITFSNAPTVGNAITILALQTDGSTTTSATFTAHASTTSATLFSRQGSDNGAANLKAAIEQSGIASLVTVSAVSGTSITITQKTGGANGNTAITSNLANVTVGAASAASNGTFSGGVDASSIGLLYYQAGVAVLSSSVFSTSAQIMNNATSSVEDVLKKSTIDNLSDGIRNRVQNISFNNTTELNSTIFFCRANHNEFNYSSNPTYLSGSKIIVKNDEPLNLPRSYVTTVGLYSPDNELMAVAKVSEPLRKDPTNELTLRVRLDY